MQTSAIEALIPPPLPEVAFADHDPVVAALTHRAVALSDGLGALRERADLVAAVAETLVGALRSGGKVLVVGNGGSAAEAQHFATELVGRFKRERAAYAVLALSVDGAVLTAVANDYGYAEVFARQVRALGRPEDVLLAFSTSGESDNVVRAARAARACGLSVVALTGAAPSRLEELADLAIRVPTTDTPLAQELHVVLLHLLCDLIETELAVAPEGIGR
jgi:D-sedoheptulose 7-phosphate isomerase